MLTQYMDSLTSHLVFYMPIWSRCSCSSALSCSAAGIIILLPFIAIPSMAAVPSVSQLLSMASHGGQALTVCLGAHHVVLSFLSLLLSCSLICLCMILLHLWWYTWLVFLCLCFFWLCLDSQSVMIIVVQTCILLSCYTDGLALTVGRAAVVFVGHRVCFMLLLL